MGSNRAPSSCPFVWPVLEDTSSPQAFTKGPRQLFGLSLLEKEGATTFRLLRGLLYFGGPGPESVCRAHPADSTTANKIQGPGSSSLGPPHPLVPFSSGLLRASCFGSPVALVYYWCTRAPTQCWGPWLFPSIGLI